MTFQFTLRPLAHALAAAFSRGAWAAAVGVLACGAAFAGAVTDGTVGPVRTFSGQFTVPASVGTVRGSNLFHSFERFGVSAGESATFLSPDAALRNVVVRVTGAEASAIDGPVRLSAPSGARPNLWFLNPNGIAVGPQGTFDVPGSLALGAAQTLDFADGSRWSTSASAGGTLSVAEPKSFGFLAGASAGRIDWRGATFVGKTDSHLALAAGGVSIAGGRIATTNGAVTVDSLSDVLITARTTLSSTVTDPAAADVSGVSIQAAGRVAVSEGSRVFTDASASAGLSGPVLVSAANVQVGGASGSGGALLQSLAQGDSSAGPVVVSARESITVAESGAISSFVRGAGASGDVSLEAPRITLRSDDANRAAVVSSVVGYSALGEAGTGRSGSVVLRRASDVEVLGNASIRTSTPGGQAGDIEVNTRNLTLDGRGFVASIDSVSGDTLFESIAPGRAGIVKLDASANVLIRNGGQVNVGVLDGGTGNGAIRVNAGSVLLDGGNLVDGPSTGLFGGLPSIFSGLVSVGAPIDVVARSIRLTGGAAVDSSSGGEGSSGSIHLRANDIAITDGASVSASSFGNGRSGGITLQANTVLVSGKGSVVNASTRDAIAGDILIGQQGTSTVSSIAGDIAIGPGTISLQEGARLFSATLGKGQGGAVLLRGNEVTLAGNSVIGVGTGLGAMGAPATAGVVDVRAETLRMSGSSNINADNFGSRAGGSISLNVGSLLMSDASVRTQNLFSPSGRGGDLTIDARGVVSMERSLITAEATAGQAGSLKISAAQMTMSSGAIRGNGYVGGRPGNIVLVVKGLLTLEREAEINVSDASERSATAGGGSSGASIDITAGSLRMSGANITASAAFSNPGGSVRVGVKGATLLAGSQITTAAVAGDGGPISLEFSGPVGLVDSRITTSVVGPVNGNGGDITIRAPIVLMSSGFIQANTEAPRARGGDVTVSTGLLLPDGANLREGGDAIESFRGGVAGYNVIQAAAPDGVKGELNVSRPALNVAGALVALSTPRIGLGRLTADFCEVATDSNLSVMTRGALYPWFSAPLGWTSRPQPEVPAKP